MADDSVSGTDQADRELETVPDARTTPLPRECLACFVWRMLDDHGCNATLRWARHWRERRAPRATAMERRLGRLGGYCDCELFLNVWVPTGRGADGPAEQGLSLTITSTGCLGVRRGSAQPCADWRRRRKH